MRATIVGTILVSAGIASAAPIAVSNYNWLQIPDGLQTSVGNSTTPYITAPGVGSGNETPNHIRWASRIWIPDGTLTANGAGDYWATLKLDQPRMVEEVGAQFYAPEGLAEPSPSNIHVRRFKVEGSLDGTSYTQIGAFDYGVFNAGNTTHTVVNTTDGTYQYIRIRLNGTSSQPGDPDYHYLSANRGGPGIFAIEPVGDGTLSDLHQVNWVNRVNYATTVANNGLDFGGTDYNSGLFFDRSPRTGDGGSWEAGDFAAIDLKATRRVGRSIVVWEHIWGGVSYNIQWSNDNINFFNVTGLSAPIGHAGQQGALEYTFDPVIARYFRVVNVNDGGGGNSIFNEVLLFNVPEPTSLGLMSVGVMLLTRRRR